MTFQPHLFPNDLKILLEIQHQFAVFLFDNDASAVNQFAEDFKPQV